MYRLTSFLYKYAYLVLFTGAIAVWSYVILVTEAHNWQSRALIEWHDIVTEIVIASVLWYWIVITRRLKSVSRTFLYFYLGAAGIILLMACKLISELLVVQPVLIVGLEVFFTLIGVSMLTLGLHSWADDFNSLIQDLDVSVSKYRELSKRDSMTGLLNREQFEKALLEAKQSNATLSMMLIDIDHFKRINDQYGHLTGDKVITRLSDQLSQLASFPKHVYRLGGEEFALLYFDCSSQQVQTNAELLLSSIRAMQLSAEEGECFGISFSAGIAHRQQDETMRSLYHRADNALYSAKQGGRSRIELG